jgi:hypothetical protein
MKERYNLAFPAILMCLVALVQIVRAHTQGQSAWKGGGFGMFSTSDSPQARFVRCTLEGPDKEYRVQLPRRLSELSMLARTVPTPGNVRDLALEALDVDWVREDWSPAGPGDPEAAAGNGTPLPGEAQPDTQATRVDTGILTYRALGLTEPRPPSELLLAPKSVRIEIWRNRLDASGKRMEAVLIRSETVKP